MFCGEDLLACSLGFGCKGDTVALEALILAVISVSRDLEGGVPGLGHIHQGSFQTFPV